MRFVAPALIATAVIAGCGSASSSSESDKDRAIAEAKAAFARAEAGGHDLSRGPCIAETLPGLPDWAADIAHDPRQPVDDVPANQCSSYRAGQTHHFIELTPTGTLIRAQ